MKMVLVAAAALSLMIACADATPNPSPTTDAVSGTDTAAVTNACMNDSDFAICDSCGTDCNEACPDTQAFAQSIATDCGLAAIGKDDERQDALDCILPATGLSADCGGCYADIVLCSIQNCIAVCLDPSSAACGECQTEFCLADFYACTGYESICDDQTDNNGTEGTDCDDRSCAFDSACAE